MNMLGAQGHFGSTGGKGQFIPASALDFAGHTSAAAPPRQRARLWELNGSVHCSVIGTCLTPAELRRVMGRLARTDIAHLSDHDLHAEAVGLCSRHNPCSKLLQKALDQRHGTVVKQFAKLADETAVMERWREARVSGAIPGAYWAALTHPRSGSRASAASSAMCTCCPT